MNRTLDEFTSPNSDSADTHSASDSTSTEPTSESPPDHAADSETSSASTTTRERTDDSDSTSTSSSESDARFPWDDPSEVPVPEDAGEEVYGNISVDAMALDPYPAPEEIVALADDQEHTAGTRTPDTDLIDPEQGVFLVMDAKEVYDYLEKQQKKTDHWLLNELKYNLQRQVIGQSHGMSENLKLSHYDKKWLVKTEIKRRKEAPGYEWNPAGDSGTKGWQPLPGNLDEESDDSPKADGNDEPAIAD